MADQLQLRRGTTAQIATFTGAQGEVIVDTDKDTLVVQDGATAGGFPLASEQALVDGTFYFNDDTSGGSIANSYILSPKSNTNIPTVYQDGQQFGFVTANANTGPSTATFSALGVRSLKWPGGIDPIAGEISGRVYLIFDATNDWFEIQDIERSTDYLDTLRIDVASSANVNLTTAAPSTRHINITGTTTIAGFTVTAGKTYFVRFNAALTLTNSASLVTQTGADVSAISGDTCIIRSTAANVVEVLSYTRPVAPPPFVSAEQTITLGAVTSLTHGLGAKPKLVTLSAICKTAELGYAVGDEIDVGLDANNNSGGASIGRNSTTLRMIVGTSGIYCHNASGAVAFITPANWRLIARAWA